MIVATASVVSTGAFAASNMENPLYMPKNREVYLKTGAGVMYKKVEGTQATEKKGISGKSEFPVWRFSGDIGYGITDRLDVHGRFGYTKDGDIDRKGMHRGRLGLMYRVMTENEPFILDLYADAYLSGITPMKGTYTARGFNFDNYSNGRWGAIGGARIGKTLKNNVTIAAHAEYLQTFGNHNNKILIDPNIPVTGTPYTMGQIGFPSEISVELKSTHETTAGFDILYQMNPKWSFGGGFEYVEHSDNGVKYIQTEMPNAASVKVAAALVQMTSDMDDGWDEYVIKANVGYQLTDDIQFTVFGEYTIDDAHPQTQNATDCKVELGGRVNLRF